MKIDIQQLWYSKNIVSTCLLPLSWIFRVVSFCRRIVYQTISSKDGLDNGYIIVVGNLTVGGAGKTPFVSYLAQRCMHHGIKVGVIARGYGRRDESALLEVMCDSKVIEVGDEALMLKRQIDCPVAVAAKRIDAAKFLYEKYKLDLIISDDGLQHYKLPRDYEIIIVDGEREFGNGRCLPAGPLREPVSRLHNADTVVCNGRNAAYEYQYNLNYSDLISLENDNLKKPHQEYLGQKVHAVAGIGHPKRFFTALEGMGLQIIPHAFPDHYAYKHNDLDFNDNLPIIMTEKDAVKCSNFKIMNAWYMPVIAVLNNKLEDRISNLLEELS